MILFAVDFFEFVAQLFSTEAESDDFALRSYEERGRDARNAIDRSGFTLPPFQVGNVVLGQVELLDGTGPSRLVAVE